MMTEICTKYVCIGTCWSRNFAPKHKHELGETDGSFDKPDSEWHHGT
jgi:hypothetical protein